MKLGFAVAVALLALGIGARTASAQGADQCSAFQRLSDDAHKKADAVQAGMKAKVDRKQLCTLMTTFVGAEGLVIKFLKDNKTWCGVPDQAITVSEANHEKAVKFRTAVCSEDGGPHLKPPSLSDAIKTPAVDSSANTKAGSFGTFNSLTGNPLAK